MPSIPESGATHHADQEIVRPDAAMNRRSESESASDDTSRTDTAPPSPTRRESSGVRAMTRECRPRARPLARRLSIPFRNSQRLDSWSVLVRKLKYDAA